ncbi:MAG: amidohydrolase [Acidobacteriota bacterium]
MKISSRLLLALVAFNAVVAVNTATAPALAQVEKIDAAVAEVAPQIIELRHRIHQYPELGNREFETAKLVADHLRSLGIEVETEVGVTGVVGLLKGGKDGPVVAVRADMDALPVTEDTPFEFKSTVRTEYLGQEVGVSHACGHDIHTSVQLGVASVLASLRDELAGTVKFIFQPAEEGPPPGEEGGASLMFEEGALENPRPAAIFGLHTFAEMEVGQLGYTIGPAFASVDHFIIDIFGKQAHGAAPHFSIDPVVMASQAVSAFQTIRSRNLPPLEPSVVTVGVIQGGERFNIIPASVHLEGTVRTYSPEVRDTVEQRMREILDGITRAGGGTFELDYQRVTPATINHRGLTVRSAPSLEAVVGSDNVIEIPPTMGGEDFAVFANEVPGFYFRLGMVKPGTESGGHHTPTFQADDSSVELGMRVMSRVLIDFLNHGAKGL